LSGTRAAARVDQVLLQTVFVPTAAPRIKSIGGLFTVVLEAGFLVSSEDFLGPFL
jgi:hypothetical protein